MPLPCVDFLWTDFSLISEGFSVKITKKSENTRTQAGSQSPSNHRQGHRRGQRRLMQVSGEGFGFDGQDWISGWTRGHTVRVQKGSQSKSSMNVLVDRRSGSATSPQAVRVEPRASRGQSRVKKPRIQVHQGHVHMLAWRKRLRPF